jgi:hypothetical protein
MVISRDFTAHLGIVLNKKSEIKLNICPVSIIKKASVIIKAAQAVWFEIEVICVSLIIDK